MTHLELETLAIVLAIAINLPFGAYRVTVRRLSWQWFAAIHVPIPFIIIMRLTFGLGWWFVPFMLASALTGQVLGSTLYRIWRTRHDLAEVETAD
jgi:hypothetical protein